MSQREMAEQIDQSQISIKGVRDGLLISFGGGAFSELMNQLKMELAAKKGFLRGSQVALSAGDRLLTAEQLLEVQRFLVANGMDLWAVLADDRETREAARELGLATRMPGSNTDLEGNKLDVKPIPVNGQPIGEKRGEVTAAVNSLFVRETLRSGRSVYHEGHVVVLGDVNPGAEIIAGGDVIVWGRVRGLVHAGALGDHSAVICALELIPTQLRIADQIAISPNDQERQLGPEKVSIRGGRIVAESWQRK